MKSILQISVVMALGLEIASGQGTVQFLNNALSRVLYQSSNSAAIIQAPTGTKIGLFWGVSSNNLSLVSPTTSIGANPGIWNGGLNYPVPGTQPGQRVYLKIAGWDADVGDNWQASSHYGETYIIQATLGTNLDGVGTVIFQGSAGSHPERMKPFTISPALLRQTIEFPPIAEKTFGDLPFPLNAVASSGLPLTYSSSDSAVGSVSNGIVTIVGAGSTTITASQAGNAEDHPASASRLLVVRKAPVAITLGNLVQTYNGTVRMPTVVTHPATPAVMGFHGPGPLPPVKAGTYEVRAIAESANFLGSVTQLFTVQKSAQVIAFPDVPKLAVGASPLTVNVTASSGLSVLLRSSNPDIVQVDGQTVTPVSAGQAMLTASQAGDGNYLAVEVSRLVDVTTGTPFYPVSRSVNGDGSIVLTPLAANYVSNTTISVSAVPSNGWLFTQWSGALSGAVNPTTFTVNAPATITANFARLPALVGQPGNVSAGLGSPVTFHVEAVGSAPLTYQWWFENSPLLNATNTELQLAASLEKEGRYHVVITNPWGSATNSDATLQITNACVTACDESSLRTAIQGGGVIRLCCDGTITLTSTLEITRDVALDARQHDLTISGNGSVRLFSVRPGVTFAVTNVTLANGFHLGANGTNWIGQMDPSNPPPDPGKPGEGGALLNEGGTVTLVGSWLVANHSQGGDGGTLGALGAIPFSIGKSGAARGGAIANRNGALRLFDVDFSSNTATGGLDRLSTFQTQSSGGAGDALGGAVYSSNGVVEIRNANLVGNVVFAPGGGRAFGAARAQGGAIFVEGGTLNIQNSASATNEAMGGTSFIGGGFGQLDSSRIPGNAFGGALGASDAAVFMQAVRFSFNRAVGGPGVRFTGNGEAQGGSMHATGSSFVQAVDCVFRGNAATVSAGSYGADGRGGAVFAGGIVLMSRCSVVANQARGSDGFPVSLGAAPAGHGFGGGIFSTGEVCLTNCTIAGNSAQGGSAAIGVAGEGLRGNAYGGGYFVGGGRLTAMNSTLASNAVMSGTGTNPVGPPILVGANIANSNGVVMLRNTILARGGTAGNVWGMVSDAGANLSSDDSANFTSPGSVNNTDPRLGPLGDNYGGMTPLMPLKPDSPAIDAGTTAGAPPIDQRGATRPFGGGFDIGAYEYHSNQTDLTELSITPGVGTFTLRFVAWPGVTYHLQGRSSQSDWMDLEVIGPLPMSTIVERSIPSGSELFRFFRTVTPAP